MVEVHLKEGLVVELGSVHWIHSDNYVKFYRDAYNLNETQLAEIPIDDIQYILPDGSITDNCTTGSDHDE